MARKKSVPIASRTLAEPERRAIGPLVELGAYGVNYQAGILYDEILPDLRYPQRQRIIRQMLSNDATIGALLYAIEMLVRQVQWRWEPASEDVGDVDAATFVAECWNDMSASPGDTIADILSFLPWGWSYHEIVYKIRGGPDSLDPTRRSKYTDGRIGWRKWPIRSQETLYQWVFDDSGGVQAMMQVAPPDYQIRTIPIDKALLFRTRPNRGNPEGWSILRNAYRSWRNKTHIENIEAIGVERDIAGLPVASVPAEWMGGDASDSQRAAVEVVKEIVKNVRNDEQAGVVLPSSVDDQGNQEFTFKLLSAAGTKQFNTSEIISRYDQRMLMSVMGDFLMLGSQQHGSFALSSDKTELFALATGTTLDTISSVANTHAVPRLMRLNGMRANPPRLVHNDIETPDLDELGTYIQKTVAAGAITPDEPLERYLRRVAELPEPVEAVETE